MFNAELDSPNRTDQTLGAKMRKICIEAKSRLDQLKQRESQERELRPDLIMPNIGNDDGLTPRSGSESVKKLMERSTNKRSQTVMAQPTEAYEAYSAVTSAY